MVSYLEIGLLIAIAILLTIGWLKARWLFLEFKKSVTEISENISHRLQREIQKEAKTNRRELLRVASSALAASWHKQKRPRYINAALPLVLITQIQRSGGTLLSQLFDGHPEAFAFPHELKWGGANKYLWPDIDPQREGPLRIMRSLVAENYKDLQTLNLFGYAKGAPGTEEPLDTQRLPIHWSEWAYVEAFLRDWERIQPTNRRQCLDIFMSSFFTANLGLRTTKEPKKFITAFAPRVNFVRSYPKNQTFFDDYSDGLMICICRHPADWYASASRHKYIYEDVEFALEQWRESAECGMQLKEQHPDQVILIDFAALVMDPGYVMTSLAAKLDLAWHPILTSPTFNGWPIESNSSFAPVAGIDASAVGRRANLAPDLCQRIEASNLVVYRRFIEAADISVFRMPNSIDNHSSVNSAQALDQRQ